VTDAIDAGEARAQNASLGGEIAARRQAARKRPSRARGKAAREDESGRPTAILRHRRDRDVNASKA